ncbi:MAG TPA: hypothetical protein GXZ48_01020 [Acholeplasmataceae bacterium]|nr:hypothetical protein [Acholeplasmataceae bacterium]
MKKILIIILLLFILTGCENNVKPNEGSITLYLSDDYTKYMNYEEVPSFTLTFDGIINTTDVDTIRTFQANFSGNDDLFLSSVINDLITKYEDRVHIDVLSVKESASARINTIENGEVKPLTYPTDDGKEYYETAMFDLENGLKLTIDYRRFVYEGNNYYCWRYERSILMWLYYPLMVIDNNGIKELLILTLPNRIKFKVGPQLNANKLIKDKTYLNNPDLYSFVYLDEFETLEEKKQYVVDYYVNSYEGYFEGNKLYFTYLGVKFFITFDEHKFYINYYGKV